jgi:general stress protein 26
VRDLAVERIDELLESGVAIMVATRDGANRPHVTRGWGARQDSVGGHLDLFITVSDDLPIVSDLEANRAIAVTIVRPTNYQAVQIYGHVEWICEVGAEDRERINTSIDRFVAEVTSIGMPPSVRLLAGDRFVAIRVAIQHCFEQTPGPRAGSAL